MKSRNLLNKAKVWLTITKNLALNLGQLRNYRKCQYLSDRQTLLYLKDHQIGITRFGDGEAGYLSGYSFSHQKQNPDLRIKLVEILKTYDHKSPFLIGFPYDIFFNRYVERNTSKNYWNSAKYSLLPYVKKEYAYGSAFCFRLPIVIDDDKKEYAQFFISLFLNKDIIFVGRAEPYPGLISPKCMIKTPPTDAYDEYDQLKETITKRTKEFENPCVLLSCGITATALSADLNRLGILAYDVGLCFTHRLAKFIKSS
jgi:hypothetical protein